MSQGWPEPGTPPKAVLVTAKWWHQQLLLDAIWFSKIIYLLPWESAVLCLAILDVSPYNTEFLDCELKWNIGGGLFKEAGRHFSFMTAVKPHECWLPVFVRILCEFPSGSTDTQTQWLILTFLPVASIRLKLEAGTCCLDWNSWCWQQRPINWFAV